MRQDIEENFSGKSQVAIGNNIVQALGKNARAILNVISFQDDEDARALRNRLNMLQLVSNIWIEGVLKKSLHNELLIELGLETRPDNLDQPWDMVLQMPENEPRLLPPGTKIFEIFDQSDGSLLILGEPGSGKTTMLLDLARQSIEHAQEDVKSPIPVVFNLSSWTPKQTLANWLVSELHNKYYIPQKIARPWVENDELLLLLDGLDEVKPEYRKACVAGINAFRAEHFVHLAVCCRRHEYESLAMLLRLRLAILIQPLTPQQVSAYLQRVGADIGILHQPLQSDPDFQEFIQTPLILSIIVLAYRHASEEDLKSLENSADYRKHLFAAFVEQMFKRRKSRQEFPQSMVLSCMGWLAQNMDRFNLSVFQIESLQPAWLSTKRQRLAYLLICRLEVISALTFPYLLAALGDLRIFGILFFGSLAAGLFQGFVDILRLYRRGEKQTPSTPSGILQWLNNLASFSYYLITLLVFPLLIGSAVGYFPSYTASTLWAFYYLLAIMLIFILPPGFVLISRLRITGLQGNIRTVEGLQWSWRRFANRFIILGVLPGLLTLAGTYAIYEPGAHLWDREGRHIASLPGFIDGIGDIKFSQDGTRFAVAGNRFPRGTMISIRDTKTGKQMSSMKSADGGLFLSGFNATGDCLIFQTLLSSQLFSWDLENDTVRPALVNIKLQGARFSPDRKHVMILEQGKGSAFLGDGCLSQEPSRLAHDVRYAYFSPDSANILTISYDGKASLWETQTGQFIADFSNQGPPIRAAAFSPDGRRLITGDASGTLHIWDMHTRVLLAKVKALEGFIWQLIFSRDGTRLMTITTEDPSRLWDTQTWNIVAEFRDRGRYLASASFSKDGFRCLLNFENGSLLLCDAMTGKVISELSGDNWASVNSEFSPDGELIVAASWNSEARLWDRQGQLLGILRHRAKALSQAHFSPDGDRIVTTSNVIDYRPESGIWLLVGLLFGIFSALESKQLEGKLTPNQGIVWTARNAFWVGVAVAFLSAISIKAILTIVPEYLRPISANSLNILVIAAAIGYWSALWYGGLDVLQHYTLRALLNITRQAPWNLIRFLDYSTERIFLRRVGGGYIFIHRMLMEHFVSSYPPANAPTTRNGSTPLTTASGSGVSTGSSDRSSPQAKKRMNARRSFVT